LKFKRAVSTATLAAILQLTQLPISQAEGANTLTWNHQLELAPKSEFAFWSISAAFNSSWNFQMPEGSKLCLTVDGLPSAGTKIAFEKESRTDVNGCVTSSYPAYYYDGSGPTVYLDAIPDGRHSFALTYSDSSGAVLSTPPLVKIVDRTWQGGPTKPAKIFTWRDGSTVNYIAIGEPSQIDLSWQGARSNCKFTVYVKKKSKWNNLSSTKVMESGWNPDGNNVYSKFVIRGSLKSSSAVQLKAGFAKCKYRETTIVHKKVRKWVCHSWAGTSVCDWEYIRVPTNKTKSRWVVIPASKFASWKG
jgi:hypothetical protein